MIKNKSFLYGLIAIVLLSVLFFAMPFANQPLFLNRFNSMAKCFQDFQIPCRWVFDPGNFYGSPVFHYTPPLLYYFGGFIFVVTGNLLIPVKFIFSLSLLGTYIFGYFFVYNLLLDRFRANLFALLFALLVFFASFRNDSLGIAWGIMLAFLALLTFSFFLKRLTIKIFLFSSVSLSLLVLSADIAPILSVVFLFWLALQYIRNKSFAYLFFGFASIVFAFLLSSFYVLPSILEKNLVYNLPVNSSYGYLPISTAEKPQIRPESPYQILTGQSVVSGFQQGTNWLRFEANTKEHSIIRLSQFYFPLWKIFVDGKEIQVEYRNNSLGLMTIILGTGEHIIEGRLFDTPIRSISNFITVVAFISALILWVCQLKRVCYWINYYRRRIN